MKVHILRNPYSVTVDPEATVREIKEIGKAYQESDVIFDSKDYPRRSSSADTKGFWAQFFDFSLDEPEEPKAENAEPPAYGPLAAPAERGRK